MTSRSCQQLRESVAAFMQRLPLPAPSNASVRGDGVREFNLHWCVRGSHYQGVFASFLDRDDIIEFGLLERDGDSNVHLLHVTLVLDDEEEGASINSLSEADADLNFDAYVTPDAKVPLDVALKFFADRLQFAE